MSKKIFGIILILFSVILLTLFGLSLAFLYKPSFFLSIIFGKKAEPAILLNGSSNNTNKTSNKTASQENVSVQVKELITKSIATLKEALDTYPAVILKIVPGTNSTATYVLTLENHEWEFSKVVLSGGLTLQNPDLVYRCGKLFIASYNTTGMWVPSVPTAPQSENSTLISVQKVDKGYVFLPFNNCSLVDSFVFDRFGDLVGVCSDGKFLPSAQLKGLPNASCEVVYRAGSNSTAAEGNTQK